jgi:toxic protein SymE
LTIKINKNRLLKVTSKFQRRSRQKWISVPEIKLSGKWLKRLGFKEGDYAKIETFEKKIVITLIKPKT